MGLRERARSGGYLKKKPQILDDTSSNITQITTTKVYEVTGHPVNPVLVK